MNKFQCLSFICVAFASRTTSKECFNGELAAKQLRKWALREGSNQENKKIELYDTNLTLIRNGPSNPTWYIAAHGWEGSFYYTSFDSQDRPGDLCESSTSGDLEDLKECQISDKTLSGAYLYPDFYTAVVGLWQNHLLIQGQITKLHQACKSGNLWILDFKESSESNIKYSPPTHYSLGVDPLEVDPYESRTVEVRNSSVEDTSAGQGLFTKRNIIKGEVLAFYNGYIIFCNATTRPLNRQSFSKEEEHIRNTYRMFHHQEEVKDNYCIDLPPELANLQRYNATLGHKVNHSFQPNSEFLLFPLHPILGTVMSLVATQDIQADQEILVDYEYYVNEDQLESQPDWFRKLWLQEKQNKEIKHEEL
ncbi:histone-lysine N-methyltransferase SETD7 [Eurytemora carolleeae]|uniref:histone-lysine N-methyltransferase SETD7 n=1 Tax=Eurytemora carolleeae TaxID=1294199 RepID=UPI000C7938BD|nr:histone-lysine N-methyltransferase SETD7 [Eurytemora carolleeae]|eukprot:XP_023320452.1 histone-lysine N-methyltransferase SETD7-like [Eurytemora affinis]